MKGNNFDRVVVNRNSWKSTQPLCDGDEVLNVKLKELLKESAE